jgi:hypothetical protein
LVSNADEADDVLHATLARLDVALGSPHRATLHADKVLNDVKQVHELGKTVPLTFFLDACGAFAQRHDALRIELLVRLAQANFARDAPPSSSGGTRSRPEHTAFDKLVSFAVSEMVRHGDLEDAMKLWVRMSHSGYVTSRTGLDKIVEKMSTCGARELPPPAFAEKMHGLMRAHRWDQSPRYYAKALAVCRQHAAWPDSLPKLAQAVARIDQVWADWCRLRAHVPVATAAATEDRAVEVVALRVKAWVAATGTWHRLVSTSPPAPTTRKDAVPKEDTAQQQRWQELGERCRAQAAAAFTDLLQLRSGSPSSPSSTAKADADAVLGSTLEEHPAALFSSLLRDVTKAVTTAAAAAPPPSVDHGSTDSPVAFPSARLRELLAPRNKASEASPSPSPSPSPSRPHYDVTRPRGLWRGAVEAVVADAAANAAQSPSLLLDCLDACLAHAAAHAASAAAPPSVAARPSPVVAKPSTLAALARKAGAADAAAAPDDATASPLPPRPRTERRPEPPRSTSVYTLTDAVWAERLLADALVAARFGPAAGPSPGERQRAHIDGVTALAAELRALAGRHGVALGAPFLAAHLRALFGPVDGPDWRAALAAAQCVVDGAEDDAAARSPAAVHGLVAGLCAPGVATRESVDHALQLLAYELPGDSPVGGPSRAAPLPATWAAVLDASVRVHTDEVLAQTLALVDERAAPAARGRKGAPKGAADVALAAARLRGLARLRLGYKSMTALRALRVAAAAHVQAHGAPPQPPAITRHTYTWLITALHLCRPDDEAEWRVAKNPVATCEWLLGEMNRDGIEANGHTLALLLRLHGKACQIARKQGNAEACVRRMEAFVDDCVAGGVKGHPKVPVTAAALREMVKAHCIAGQDEAAMALLQTAEARYGVRPSAAAYEPLVFSYALLEQPTSRDGRRPLALAEDVVALMASRGVAPSDAVADALLLGYLRGVAAGGPSLLTGGTGTGGSGREKSAVLAVASDAMDRVQEMYTAHGARPSVAALLRLLDTVLDAGDVHEARRLVVIVEQLFTEDERHLAVHYPFATHRQAYHKRHLRQRARQAILGDNDGDDGTTGTDGQKDRWRHGTASSAGGGAAGDVADDDDDFDDLSLLQPAPGASGAGPPSLLSKSAVAAERGALAPRALAARFAARGLKM